jgi:hypothetical protein
MDNCFKNTVANCDYKFGIIMDNYIVSNRKNLPQKMRRHGENGDKLSGGINLRVNCRCCYCSGTISDLRL